MLKEKKEIKQTKKKNLTKTVFLVHGWNIKLLYANLLVCIFKTAPLLHDFYHSWAAKPKDCKLGTHFYTICI